MRTLLVLSICLGAACATTKASEQRSFGKIISPADSGMPSDWSEAEKAAPLTVRNLRRSPEASFHLVRMQNELPARMHQHSDLTLVVVSGSFALKLGDQVQAVRPGDVIEIPRATPYGAKVEGSPAGVLYQVFTPALATDDTLEQPQVTREDPWRWNLWPQ
jgi:mannose-6-phosphate isomerase-like protein (cupin superfamily)